MDEPQKISIQKCLKDLGQCPGHEHRLGPLTPLLGYPLIISFSIFLLPLFIYMHFFNLVYFWLRRQKPLDPKDFYHYDRHKIAHISFLDKIWCEYCEWANGTLQWTLAILNEVERRYCPIKNKTDPHCSKVKLWREKFLEFEHSPDELEKYYQDQYLKDTPSITNTKKEKL